MKKILFLLYILVLFSSCEVIKTIYIASYTLDCDGEASQTCLLVKEHIEDEWTYFYDTIEGFEYEKGYHYKIEISVKKAKNPKADDSSLKYSLFEIISKEKDNTKEIKEDKVSLEYEFFTRISYYLIKINENTATKVVGRINQKESYSKNYSYKDWKTIFSLIQKIQVVYMNDLPPPSVNHWVDAAMHAQLRITLGDKTYTSKTFDHGNPPQELKELINTILSLTKSIE